MKNVHVSVPVFLYAVTKLIFQIKRIFSSEKWCNYVVTFLFLNARNLGRSDDSKRRKKEDGLTLLLLCPNTGPAVRILRNIGALQNYKFRDGNKGKKVKFSLVILRTK